MIHLVIVVTLVPQVFYVFYVMNDVIDIPPFCWPQLREWEPFRSCVTIQTIAGRFQLI